MKTKTITISQQQANIKKDLANIAKLVKVLSTMPASGSFYLVVSTDVDTLAAQLKAKQYRVYQYSVQVTKNVSVNIYN